MPLSLNNSTHQLPELKKTKQYQLHEKLEKGDHDQKREGKEWDEPVT